MNQSFSVLCHRLASRNPHLSWAEVCRQVSAMLRPAKAAPQKAQQNRLWWQD